MDHQIFFQKTQHAFFDQTRENKSLSDQQYSIEMFLNDDVLINETDKKQHKIVDNPSLTQISTQKHPQCHSLNETPVAMKRKSIFHNFQKHLITLLKRVINISQCPIDNLEGTQLIRSLWRAFLKCKSFNKKIMHTVFGCAGNKNSYDELKAISEQFKEFEQVTSNYQPEQIFQAQKLIRKIVVSQTKDLSRSAIQSNTNISRFDQFYEYFLSFLQEIEFGQMSKTRKVDQVKKLAKKPQTF